jgi:hypothetical protein
MDMIEDEIKEKNEDTADNNNRSQDQRSTQENKQDLDQQQQVDVKPSQINLQKIDLTVTNQLDNYAGKMTGVLYKNSSSIFVAKADVFLYFGYVNELPVCKTKSDENGNYSFEDLPPGYYCIKASYDNYLGATVYNIKVLPGQNSNNSIYLSELTYNGRRARR